MAAAIDPVLADAKRVFRSARQAADAARRTVETGRKYAPKIVRETRAALDERVDRVRGRADDAAELAADHLDEARAVAAEQVETARIYLAESMRERPVAATVAALGVGFILGTLLAGRRR